jgi:hypothetical protein
MRRPARSRTTPCADLARPGPPVLGQAVPLAAVGAAADGFAGGAVFVVAEALPIWLPAIWLATLMFACSAPHASLESRLQPTGDVAHPGKDLTQLSETLRRNLRARGTVFYLGT